MSTRITQTITEHDLERRRVLLRILKDAMQWCPLEDDERDHIGDAIVCIEAENENIRLYSK